MYGSAIWCIAIAVCTLRGHAHAFQRVLKSEGVNDRGEHAHVVGGRTIHPGLFVNLAAPNVTTAHDDGHRNAGPADFGDLIGHHPGRVDVEPAAIGGESLPRDLEEDARKSRSRDLTHRGRIG